MIVDSTGTGILDDYGNDLDGYVWGITADGERALIVLYTETDTDGTAYTATFSGSRLVCPRWECSAKHLFNYAEVYEARFSGGVR